MAVISTNKGKKNYIGVYNHALERISLCGNYFLYTPLSCHGFYFAPLLELMWPEGDTRPQVVPRKSKSTTQWLTYEDICTIRRVWIHVIHVSELTVGSRDEWIHMEGNFFPQLELDPDDSREAIRSRSYEQRDVLV